jgi:hypothetical protein
MSIERYLLLDANLLAGYYAPQTLTCQNAAETRERIAAIVESVRKGCSPHLRLLVPEICVAETQTVLSKHANPKWKGAKLKKDDPQSIHGKSYSALQKRMTGDLHSGSLIESIPLQRYHVLSKHLITPIDHHTHIKPGHKGQRPRELGGTDQLICGMAFWLHRFLGTGRLVVITADYRMAKVLEKARKLKVGQIENWGIQDAADRAFGFAVAGGDFPPVMYLPTTKDAHLRMWLGSWPMPMKKVQPAGAGLPPTKKHIATLLGLYQAMGINRDRLPYTKDIKRLTQQFNDATGRQFTEHDLWPVLVGRLKQGGGAIKKTTAPTAARVTAV